jgi:hypothetical protein
VKDNNSKIHVCPSRDPALRFPGLHQLVLFDRRKFQVQLLTQRVLKPPSLKTRPFERTIKLN